MLFNSFYFILIFLPICLIIFLLSFRLKNRNIRIIWLVLCSLFFYGWWNFYYLILIISSVLFNYFISSFLHRPNKIIFLWIGIISNLSLLGYFKYFNFFIENINELTGSAFLIRNIILPLGISFFTFQQISYIVDIYNKKSKKGSLLYYFVFVVFFPQLIAGPIVNYRKIIDKFYFNNKINFIRSIIVGFSIFTIGLFKKLCIADQIGIYSNHIFEIARYGISLTFFEAWAGAIAFTFQLYFDFSGYSDMAVGLGLMFGISLPLNFNSPFKSKNISSFWLNWHISLSDFIRHYIFTPLSLFLSKYAILNNYNILYLFFLTTIIPIMTTYILVGVWHGAGWNYILFGITHGLYLIIYTLWKNFLYFLAVYDKFKKSKIWAFISQYITFICVVIAFVLFKAESVQTASNIYYSMFGINKISLPNYFLSNYQDILLRYNFVFDGLSKNTFVHSRTILTQLFLLLIISMYLPNSFQIMKNYLEDNDQIRILNESSLIKWKPNVLWCLLISMMFFLSLLSITSPSEFLYFDF